MTSLVPGFVLGFLAMAVVRSIGDWTLGSNGAAFGVWSAAAVGVDHQAARRLLGVADSAGHGDGGGWT